MSETVTTPSTFLIFSIISSFIASSNSQVIKAWSPFSFLETCILPTLILESPNILGDSSINVGSMQVSRKEKDDQALMTCELDDAINDEIIEKIKNIEDVVTVSLIGDD